MGYDIGDQPRFTTTFQDSDQANEDPTVVVAKVRTPAGGETTYTYGVDAELVRDAKGVYHIDVRLTSAGSWSIRFVGTGLVVAAVEVEITAVVSNFVSPL